MVCLVGTRSLRSPIKPAEVANKSCMSIVHPMHELVTSSFDIK